MNKKEDASTICIVQNRLPLCGRKRIMLRVRSSDPVHNLYRDVRNQLDIKLSFALFLLATDGSEIELTNTDKQTLEQAGIIFQENHRNKIAVSPALQSNPAVSPIPSDFPEELTTIRSRKKVAFMDETSAAPLAISAVPPSATVTNSSSMKYDESMIVNNSATCTITSSTNTMSTAAPSRLDDFMQAADSTNDSMKEQTSKPRIINEDYMIELYLDSTSGVNNVSPTTSNSNYETENKAVKLYSPPRTNYGYVGLVNQAMTCYLNSLLQALFMTPEFRNAMYNWEFDGKDEDKSIPYQLQKLFLNLQTSTKSAVETTDLTRSFGWDSTEAWQQHDVQELCRVMFDALEQKFKNTSQSDLINRLYEGKMMDYVKCLDCNTEKSREDTFLDIPLPVRPFGSSVAYESVEEAMQAFVDPEKLDGNNQYFCEKCNHKSDAHKGLKFTRFPYILTLHLKRFDFDYQTFHRIKLNDKVTFPQTLNLNGFVKDYDALGGFMQQQQQPTSVTTATGVGSTSSEHGSVESAIKCDDCSTTDSESAIEEESSSYMGGAGGNTNKINDSDLQDDDEGIDMSTSASDTHKSTSMISSNESGPYVYELFAIMIHSGSASGGHYYAYIKEFETGDWFCFNDQSVSAATQEDINKSFGGGTSKTYYSGAYSSSTNAYMLMYRQQDSQRNVAAVKSDEFPAHITKLLQHLKDKKEADQRNREIEAVQIKFKVYFRNTRTRRTIDFRMRMNMDATLEELLEDAYQLTKASEFAPIERCRLVAYNHNQGQIMRSFEGEEKLPLSKSTMHVEPMEMMLEIRDEGAEFEIIEAGSVLTKVFVVDINSGDVDGPTEIRGKGRGTVAQYKQNIATKLGLNVDHIVLALLKYSGLASVLDCDKSTLALEEVKDKSKVFVAVVNTKDETISSKLTKIVERFEHIITLYFVLPNTDKDILEKMSIPSYEEGVPIDLSTGAASPKPPISESSSMDVVDAMMSVAPRSISPIVSIEYTSQPIPTPTASGEPESNSEDSSLSDGDRTLVDSAPDIADLSSTNNSPACSDTQLSSPEYHNRRITDFDCDDEADVATTVTITKTRQYYFKAAYFNEQAVLNASGSGSSSMTSSTSAMISSTLSDSDIPPPKPQKMLKVLVDQCMIMGNLKRALEPFVKVPKEYFKIFRMSSSTEIECTRLTEALTTFKDGERLVIELGRALRKGEFKCKVYHLKLSDSSKDDFEKLPVLCEWIFRNGADVGQTKREIIAHLATVDPKFQNMTYDTCRLRKNGCRFPSDIYTDDKKFDDDIRLSESFEIILQELEETSQPYHDPDDLCLFLRRWNPSTMTLGPFQEITVSQSTPTELKNLIAAVSNIPEDRIEHAKTMGSFPRFSTPLLNIHTSLGWNSQPLYFDDRRSISSQRTGETYYYKDKNESLKELTPEERRELTNKENVLYGRTMYSSPRREHALKFY